MGGSTKTTQTQNQQTEQGPWAPSQPMLAGLINRLGGADVGPTASQTNAVNSITAGASGLPNFAPQATALTSDLFAGGPDRTGTLSDAYKSYTEGMTPTARGDYVNPNSNPALRGYLDTINADVSNNVNSLFGAAGRDLSGAHTQALARGIAQGEAPVLANEYNFERGNQLAAQGGLLSAGMGTTAGLSSLDEAALARRGAGIGVAGSIPGLATLPGQAQLEASNTAYSLPLTNLSQIEQLALPIAGMGSTGTSNTVGQNIQQQPLGPTLVGGLLGGLGLAGKMGLFGAGGAGSALGGVGSALGGVGSGISSMLAGLPLMFSDERVKEDIAEVGELKDGTPVYSYHYIGDDVPRIGLLAQDIEKIRPDAVAEIGGIKAVDYGKATERSRIIGMLDMAA